MKLKEFYQYKRELKKKWYLAATASLPKYKVNLSSFLSPKVYIRSARRPRGILTVKSSLYNTIFTLTTVQGKVVFARSCGCLGFQGKKKRATKFAVESTLQVMLTKAKELGWSRLILQLNGFSKGRLYALKSLKKGDIFFSKIIEKTPIAHNGCRPKKVRRG